MGERLLHLDVINVEALPAAGEAVRHAFQVAGNAVGGEDIGAQFQKLGDAIQFAVTCAMVLCSQCWPMHMYRGFGCAVSNDLNWAGPSKSNVYFDETDNAIAALKSRPQDWQLLRKSASRIGLHEPVTWKTTKSAREGLESPLKKIVKQYEKKGYPQPKYPYNHIVISDWYFPFATWSGASMYTNCGHNLDLLLRYQCDPGRFFWAWTVGKFTDLRPGQAIVVNAHEHYKHQLGTGKAARCSRQCRYDEFCCLASFVIPDSRRCPASLLAAIARDHLYRRHGEAQARPITPSTGLRSCNRSL
jgi:hypothetical protein